MINEMLEKNDVMVRIGATWYRLDEVQVDEGRMPIFVSDEDGGEHEFDMADIDEYDNSETMDPLIMIANSNVVGIA